MALRLRLYGKQECDLCDKAEALIAEVLSELLPNTVSEFSKIDIESDAFLMSQYGMTIPVLQREDTLETLFWPFPPSRVRDFLLK